MKKILIIGIIFFESAYSQQANFSDYFNLRIGNIYVYNCTRWFAAPPEQCNDQWRMRIVITDTITGNDKIRYYTYSRNIFRVLGTCAFHSYMFPFYVGNVNAIRLDTLNGNIYYYNPGNPCFYSPSETMIDSLNSKLNDTVKIRCVPSPYSYKCIDTNGNKKYYNDNPFLGPVLRREYVRGIGLVDNYYYSLQSGMSNISEQILTGRVINGVVYGDTACVFVSVITLSNEVPASFDLFQNYPNPFNPVTRIKFSIPHVGQRHAFDVRLIIYDILGREIATLVNEQLQPGTYETEWDGGNYNSGVYFYKLTTTDYTETRKMVLLK